MAFTLETPLVRDHIGTIRLDLEDETGLQADARMTGHIPILAANEHTAANWNGDIRAQLEARAAGGDTDAETHLTALWAFMQYVRAKAVDELLP